MSVGHLARELEKEGIPTVIIAVEAFKENLLSMNVPRALFTSFPLGRPLGYPGNKGQHQKIVKEALDLLEDADNTNTYKISKEKYM
ncbi:MAG: hypothetical protein SCJ93_04000 [Bacillota bacterium]|nr:hypothetical protein [Bacillota bacterium]